MKLKLTLDLSLLFIATLISASSLAQDFNRAENIDVRNYEADAESCRSKVSTLEIEQCFQRFGDNLLAHEDFQVARLARPLEAAYSEIGLSLQWGGRVSSLSQAFSLRVGGATDAEDLENSLSQCFDLSPGNVSEEQELALKRQMFAAAQFAAHFHRQTLGTAGSLLFRPRQIVICGYAALRSWDGWYPPVLDEPLRFRQGTLYVGMRNNISGFHSFRDIKEAWNDGDVISPGRYAGSAQTALELIQKHWGILFNPLSTVRVALRKNFLRVMDRFSGNQRIQRLLSADENSSENRRERILELFSESDPSAEHQNIFERFAEAESETLELAVGHLASQLSSFRLMSAAIERSLLECSSQNLSFEDRRINIAPVVVRNAHIIPVDATAVFRLVGAASLEVNDLEQAQSESDENRLCDTEDTEIELRGFSLGFLVVDTFDYVNVNANIMISLELFRKSAFLRAMKDALEGRPVIDSAGVNVP